MAAQKENPLHKDPEHQPPDAENKRVRASLAHSMESVIEQAFDEANKRDPHQKNLGWYWLMLIPLKTTSCKEIC